MSRHGRDRTRETREIIPTNFGAGGEEIRLRIGSQRLRVPMSFFLKNTRDILDGLEEWKRSAGPRELAVYAAVKGAVNLALPLIRAGIDRMPLFPPMPPRERHSDPVLYLLGYFGAASPYAMTKGEIEVEIGEDGLVEGAHWDHLDELREQLDAEDGLIEAPDSENAVEEVEV